MTGPSYSATPSGVTFTQPRRPANGNPITGYRFSRKDLGELTPAPVAAGSYTHAAPLEYPMTYEYTVIGIQSNGACTTASVMVAAPKPLTPVAAARLKQVSGPNAHVEIGWGAQADRPTSYLVLGPGLPQTGTEVAASPSGVHSVETGNLPLGMIGGYGWLVVPIWKTPAGNAIDVSFAARVTFSSDGGASSGAAASIWDNLNKAAEAYAEMLKSTVLPR
jgi:hypothetical protein